MDLQGKTEQFPPYQVVESAAFTEQSSILVSDPRLRDDLQREFYSVLPMDPEQFPKVPGTTLRAVTIVGFPALTLFFVIENRVIPLLEIHPL
jgi:hypothetical protein